MGNNKQHKNTIMSYGSDDIELINLLTFICNIVVVLMTVFGLDYGVPQSIKYQQWTLFNIFFQSLIVEFIKHNQDKVIIPRFLFGINAIKIKNLYLNNSANLNFVADFPFDIHLFLTILKIFKILPACLEFIVVSVDPNMEWAPTGWFYLILIKCPYYHISSLRVKSLGKNL